MRPRQLIGHSLNLTPPLTGGKNASFLLRCRIPLRDLLHPPWFKMQKKKRAPGQHAYA